MSDEAKVVQRFPIFGKEDELGASFEILSDGTFYSSGEVGSVGHRIASRTIDAIQQVYSRRWIPVSERLPNYGEHVFALWPTDDPDEPVAVAARYHATEGPTPLFETWDERITDESFTQPTHWTPEPPKP